MDIKQVQKMQVEILETVVDICEKNDIQYFIAQGTLLGAVRYGGFIPWDDDIDILVDWRDVRRLAKIFREQAPPHLLLTNYRVEKHFPLIWTKIRNTNTLSMPKIYKDLPINWGICIDIFPICNISNNKLIRKLEMLLYKIARKLLFSEFAKYDKNPDALARLLSLIPIPVRHLLVRALVTPAKFHKKPTEYVMIACKGGRIVKRSDIYGGKSYLMFEGRQYSVPYNYKQYLCDLFGEDYMTPPPEDKRGGHDLVLGEIIWKADITMPPRD